MALNNTGDLAGAVTFLKRAVAIDPQHAIAHCDLGLVLSNVGDTKGAIASYKRAVALDPKGATPTRRRLEGLLRGKPCV